MGEQNVRGHSCGIGPHDHEVVPGREVPIAGEPSKNRPELAPKPIAHDGTAHSPRYRERDTRHARAAGIHPGGGVSEHDRERAVRSSTAGSELGEGTAPTDLVDQADSRFRPLARRALMIACPLRVDMRCRNPWRLARRRLLG